MSQLLTPPSAELPVKTATSNLGVQGRDSNRLLHRNGDSSRLRYCTRGACHSENVRSSSSAGFDDCGTSDLTTPTPAARDYSANQNYEQQRQAEYGSPRPTALRDDEEQ